jgi:replicative DNA helicase
LRDSGSLEQDADWIFGIYHGAHYFPRTAERDAQMGGHFSQLLELGVLKARESVANVPIPVRFEGEYTRTSAWPDAWDWEQYSRMSNSDENEGAA